MSRTAITVIVIILFHVVGLTGFFIAPVRPLFLHIVPFHILLMFGMIIYSYGRADSRLLLFVLTIYIIGYSGEWIGVHKNWIFGDYTYGKTLGVKLGDIPVVMGLNWFLLIYAAAVLMQRSRIRYIAVRVMLGALILVALDVLIEPVAMRFDYWQWTDLAVPLNNYIGWFAISAVSLLLFEGFKFKKQSIAAPVLLITQFFFFGLLHFI